jgi:hypothetical protein
MEYPGRPLSVFCGSIALSIGWATARRIAYSSALSVTGVAFEGKIVEG